MADWVVYILSCKDKTLYTGITNDLPRRLQQHENGQGAKYTKGRGPFQLIYIEKFAEKGLALSREHEIKQLTREQKLALIV